MLSYLDNATNKCLILKVDLQKHCKCYFKTTDFLFMFEDSFEYQFTWGYELAQSVVGIMMVDML